MSLIIIPIINLWVHPEKKKSKRLFLRMFIIFYYICFVYWINVFLSSRANVDDLQTIENKSNFVSSDNMPNYVKGAFISMEDERFLNIMDSISKGQHVHYFQRLVNVRYKVGVPLLNKL